MILTNRYVIAIVIPLALLMCGALLKKIVRHTGWQRSDYFLGAELALSSIGSAMVHLYDLKEKFAAGATQKLWSQMATTASFMELHSSCCSSSCLRIRTGSSEREIPKGK